MEPYPNSPESDTVPQGKGPAPASVKMAVRLIWTNVALSVVSTILTFTFLDDIVDTAMQGTGGADRDTARLGAIVALVVGVALAALFAYFIAKGANWARIVYTVLLGLGILLNLFGLFGSQPAILLIITVLSLLLSVAIVFFLYRPDSNSYFKTGRVTN